MLDQRVSPTLANRTNAGQELDATESGDYPMSTRSLERKNDTAAGRAEC
jgi:hypothetical protein